MDFEKTDGSPPDRDHVSFQGFAALEQCVDPGCLSISDPYRSTRPKRFTLLARVV